jgi:hypothetical protein
MIGFDFAVISSASKLDLASSQAARNNLHMRLKEREKNSFVAEERLANRTNSHAVAGRFAN